LHASSEKFEENRRKSTLFAATRAGEKVAENMRISAVFDGAAEWD